MSSGRLVAAVFKGHDWDLVYQSRSGSPRVPWLEPDVCDHLEKLHQQGVTDVVVIPIGFVSDHLEVRYDLDTEAKDLCERVGMGMWRAQTVGTHPRFVRMIRELVQERMAGGGRGVGARLALGVTGAKEDVCPMGCCLPPESPESPVAGGRSGHG